MTNNINRQLEIQNNLSIVQSNIYEAMKSAGRDIDALTLIGVTKYFPASDARILYELGVSDLGENRVLELLEKEKILAQDLIHPNWHLIGTLQTNKVRMIIGHADLIHSVASDELIHEIQKRSAANSLTSEILLQVNVSGEESKHGFSPSEMKRVMETVNQCPNIMTRGIMTMAPISEKPHAAAPIFEKTKILFDDLASYTKIAEKWNFLSMGMSQDYIDAILYGSTHIRVGTAIFGHHS